ncbi:MAG: YecA family protein [Gammaproteobacteria bacterium]|nr:MAG: YecA family protein [Gammaproteobacteria bacterium]
MQSFPDISQLEGLLFDVDAALGAIEAHGALCGMLCAQGATEASQWMLQVLGNHEESSKALQQVGKKLLQIHQISTEQLNSVDVDFELMLPDDDEELESRVEALGVWCQGFVYGLAIGGIKEDTELPEDSKELIHDILEISRAGYIADDEAELAILEEGDEEDEVAFMEVSEYVRVGVLLVYEELQPLQSSQTVH